MSYSTSSINPTSDFNANTEKKLGKQKLGYCGGRCITAIQGSKFTVANVQFATSERDSNSGPPGSATPTHLPLGHTAPVKTNPTRIYWEIYKGHFLPGNVCLTRKQKKLNFAGRKHIIEDFIHIQLSHIQFHKGCHDVTPQAYHPPFVLRTCASRIFMAASVVYKRFCEFDNFGLLSGRKSNKTLRNMNTVLMFVIMGLVCRFKAPGGGFGNLKFGPTL